MSLEINRRDFLKVIFTTTSAAAVSGVLTHWPAAALNRPVREPVVFADDGYGYLIDSSMEYYDFGLPTFREYLNLEGLGAKQLKTRLKKEEWRFEHLISASGRWNIDEVQEWLDSDVEFDDLSLREGMTYTPYGPPIEFYDQLPYADSEKIGLVLIEGDHPGSSFAGIQLLNTPDDANRELQKLGINVIVEEA